MRAGFTLPQVTSPIADWAAKNNIKKVVTLVTDYGPGIDAETQFKKPLHGRRRPGAAELRVPLKNPDFAPFLQRVRDASPDAVFVFVPSGVGSIFMKQFAERGLDKSGIKLIGTGDVTDDDILNDMGDVALGVDHLVALLGGARLAGEQGVRRGDARSSTANLRANFHSVGGYDGMHLIYKALEATKGDTNGEALVNAMKGMAWESPRGPMSIDRDTRDVDPERLRAQGRARRRRAVERRVRRRSAGGEGSASRSNDAARRGTPRPAPFGRPAPRVRAEALASAAAADADHPLRRHRLRHAAVRARESGWR